MVMGALSLLTPCVFPMVPITVSYFTSHAATRRRTAVVHALVYSVGIIGTFTALGTILALVFGASGMNLFAANPWINLLITAIFLSFAFNLFGAYEIAVPSTVLTRLDALSRRSAAASLAGPLLMGLTFTLTSFTCTAPFVGTLFVTAAQGDWQWPLVGMLAFSTIFAMPFFLLALAPQLVSQLPRAGGWLNSVKVAMGFLEVAAAMKFISNVDLVWGWNIFTRDVVLASWIAIGVLLSLYLLGVFRVGHDEPVQRLGAGRLASALATLALSVYLVTGLSGSRLGEIEAFLPPAADEAGGRPTGRLEGELPWIVNDYDAALTTAKRENKLLFVDFTGYTCTNCRWMEANMFPRPEVRRELERYVRVRLYTDGDGELYERYQRMQATMFKTVALPLYAVLSSDGQPLHTFPGLTRKSQDFVTFLQRPLAIEAARRDRP
jgi:thiol:disulfide interchange protein DsbD